METVRLDFSRPGAFRRLRILIPHFHHGAMLFHFRLKTGLQPPCFFRLKRGQNMLTAKLILIGLRSYLTPKAKKRLAGRSTGSARYCYTVWLRHLVKTFKNDFQACPATVAELGPGHSIGVGLAALISGVEKYFGFDITRYADLKKNLAVFHELVSLFTNREDIPGPKEFPRVNPQLESYEFPHYVLTDEWLRKSLNENRIKKIENSILNVNKPHSVIEYAAPWYDSHVLEKDSIDIKLCHKLF